MDFKVQDKVEHILSGHWLTVIAVDGDDITCRTKDFRTVTLYAWELRKV